MKEDMQKGMASRRRWCRGKKEVGESVSEGE